ncbi:MAG TPA: DUF4032 domain-containing protein [Azospirillaceae bacterium]|nr:DUF4032 domain-containing protein [Azospirillaceae bacterium]
MFIKLARPGSFALGVGLPWDRPLEEWPDELLVQMPRGISRNVVRFVPGHEGDVFALKEVPERVALREYELLRSLRDRGQPAVEPVGFVTGRQTAEGAPLMSILITRYLDHALPYRLLFESGDHAASGDSLLDALVDLLIRLHLCGFYWGDCSLSNTLFRRDAGRLAAYLVDAETGELHPDLSEGVRLYDVELAQINVAGELMDLAAGPGLPEGFDPLAVADELGERYRWLWCELTRDEVFAATEQYRVQTRLKILNDYGFDVDELEMQTTDGGHRMVMRAKVVEAGHHKKQLHHLTGLEAEENQSRQLLNDLSRYRARLELAEGRPIPEQQAAIRWLHERYAPTLDAIPEELRGRLDDPELYFQILEHRWYLSEAQGRDVGRDAAISDYIDHVLSRLPDRPVGALQEPYPEP